MNKQHSNEMKSIRKKLLAAIAMLLVAVIMTVSSTYAWFTLSTAPEVKGITTTVGANGNLEIALGTNDTVYGTSTPGSNEGDSMDKSGKAKTEANITWGNLVDLSDASYGLDKIKLYPTRLNATANKTLSALSPLKYAEYGTDGRIVELNPGTMVGYYNSTTNGFMALTTPNYAGVNAIGSASSMTEREFAVRNNKNAIESYRNAAINEAKGAISLYAGDLAALALEYQDEPNDSTKAVEQEDIDTLNNLILKLEAANSNIGNSLKSAVLVYLASENSNLDDEAWRAAVGQVANSTMLEIAENPLVPTAVGSIVSSHKAIYDKLTAAKTALTNAAADGYTWAEVKETVSGLLNASGIRICGYTIAEIKNSYSGTDKTVFNDLTQKGMSGQIRFTFTQDSGIFGDIAKMTGKYTGQIQFPTGFAVEGILLDFRPWPVDVEALIDNGFIGEAASGMADMEAPGADASSEKALTDTYGYTIDMIFRTNANDSFLQLQTEAANRIYEENDNAALMGGGSNMSFTTNTEYNVAKINGLAEGIRVVFYNTAQTNAGGEVDILAVATLDTENGIAIGDEYKLDLRLVDYTIEDSGKITIVDQADSASICALTANQEKKVSALVFLDGDVIDNGDIGALQLLEGKLNLQFSSSAALRPMDNNTLMNTVKE